MAKSSASSLPPPRRTHMSAKAKLEAAQYDTARSEALFASIGEGVIATDEKGYITRINQVALDLLGYSKSEVLGKRFTSKIIALHDNGSPINIIDRPIVRAFMTGQTVNARTSYKRKDGSMMPIGVTVSPIIFRKKPIGAIEVFRDLSSEIESDKLKSDFISIASHQLRTPLSAINMYTRMLQDGLAGELTEHQLSYIHVVLSSVERMNELIDTLLNITRIEAGGITIRPKNLEFDKLVSSILTEFMPLAAEKNITLSHSIAPSIPPVVSDPLLLKEICANLLSNAIKYTPDGGAVEISVTASKNDLRFAVMDNGYGIPDTAQKHIFTKFFRADNITIQDVSGTGLGLYLIKTIADNLGGELWFESQENVGTTFYFSLPVSSKRPTDQKFIAKSTEKQTSV